MKQKTFISIALLSLFIFQTARAQTYKHKLTNSTEHAVEFVLSQSPISIEGYDGDEVIIKNSDYEAPPERAKGLHPIYGNGPDVGGIGLSATEEDGTLKFVQTQLNAGDFTVKVPNNVRVIIKDNNLGSGDIDIRNLSGEIEAKTKTGNITLNNITGPVVASSISGQANIVFSHLSDATPSAISILAGNIDVTLPTSTKADLKLDSVSGEIYTDLDIDIKGNEDNLRRLIGGSKIEGTLNGGGTQLKIKTVSGNIYLRKEK